MGNSFGQRFCITTFGESHGPALGAVVDGVSAGLSLTETDIQYDLDRRKPGQSKVSTARKESDKVEILSGVFEGQTTGMPIALLIRNTNQKSKDYDAIKDVFRPGHADFTYLKKYGIRDYRGGGRASGRETVARVAAGAIAKKMLAQTGVKIVSYSLEIAGIRATNIDFSEIEKNIVRCPDKDQAKKMSDAIQGAAKAGDSVGGIIELQIQGVPIGLGDPVFDKLDAKLAQAMMSIGAVKGVEFGAGFAAAKMMGSECNDAFSSKDGDIFPVTNHAGGILGGISTGSDIVCRLAVKPTPSIAKMQKTVDVNGDDFELCVHGRHDPCVCPRLVPVVDAMAAITLVDFL